MNFQRFRTRSMRSFQLALFLEFVCIRWCASSPIASRLMVWTLTTVPKFSVVVNLETKTFQKHLLVRRKVVCAPIYSHILRMLDQRWHTFTTTNDDISKGYAS